MGFRHVVFAASLALAVPTTAAAQLGRPGQTPAYRDGYERGVAAGTEDRRRGDRFNYSDEQDYRHAESFYRGTYSQPDVFRDQFRRGFESGYRLGYERPAYARGGFDSGYGYGRDDLAAQNGYQDGYQAGQNDFRGHRRYEPAGEGRYRSGDHGYKGWYGPKDVYRTRYRDAFMDGYRRGYVW